jgi:hypothetical protein
MFNLIFYIKSGKKIGDIGKKGAQAAQKAVNMFKGDQSIDSY